MTPRARRAALFALALAACSTRSTPDAAHSVAPSASALSASDSSATPAVDAAVAPSVVPRLRGITAGYVRFIHLAPGLGPLHFVGRNAPNYDPSFVEATVEPGAASPYLLTLAVPHRVDVYPAGANPDAGAPLTSDPIVDVYAGKGCTAVLIGVRPAPAPRGRRAPPAPVEAQRYALQLSNVVDLNRHSTAGTAMLRFYDALTNVRVPMAVREAGSTGEAIVPGIEFGDVTGIRSIPAGLHTFALEPAGGSPMTLEPVRVPPNVAHTLWIYETPAGPRSLLTRDVPGETP